MVLYGGTWLCTLWIPLTQIKSGSFPSTFSYKQGDWAPIENCGTLDSLERFVHSLPRYFIQFFLNMEPLTLLNSSGWEILFQKKGSWNDQRIKKLILIYIIYIFESYLPPCDQWLKHRPEWQNLSDILGKNSSWYSSTPSFIWKLSIVLSTMGFVFQST